MEIDYKISNHCQTRYAERIMGKDNKNDINRFIAENNEKIKTDLIKMVNYGTLIYTGKQSTKDGNSNVVDVFIKDQWIILVDQKTHNMITIFYIDLGCGDDFNKEYISRMMDKINVAKEDLSSVQEKVEGESAKYKEIIEDNVSQINEYKGYIKNLEELNRGYQSIIDNNIVQVAQANKQVADTVNTLIGKREF